MDLKQLKEQGLAEIIESESLEDLKKVRDLYLSKKGLVPQLMTKMRDLSPEQRKDFGQQVNALKQHLLDESQKRFEALTQEEMERKLASEKIDLTLPGVAIGLGQLHPLTQIEREIIDVFREMGYSVIEGDEVELDKYNFERANIPEDHPARQMQDTFVIDVEYLLRSHTTAIQTRALEAFAPQVPIKVLCPGKVYRKDDDDATHSHQFMQIEGLVVGHGVTMADLKGTLELLARQVIGQDSKVRLRTSYFQFTEPSVEVDISCHLCQGEGCSLCKHTGWIEILGAGMVHPHVLKMAGYEDPTITGFAFGVGIERVAMLRYGIEDIRAFYTNDQRFLKQFKGYE